MRNTIFLLAGFLLFGCSLNEGNGFTKLNGKDTGIIFNNINVENEEINIFSYEYLYNGGGVAVGDINNDGLPDVYFSSNNLENKLYLNKGDFKFEDITAESGSGCKQGWKTGVSMVDINSDGWLDIYVCRSADGNPVRRRNSLLINNGDLTFTDQASEYGLADESYTTQAAFFDYDRDGDLDAFLLNHSLLQISNSFNINSINRIARYPHVGNRLLRNDSGRFVDVSDSSGIYGPSSNYGLGIGISDFNNDGWPDIYVSNDYVDSDKLLINDQKGKFVMSTDSLLSHISQFSMGLDIGDVNRDGHMDIMTLDMLPEDNRRQKLLFGPENYFVHASMKKNGYSSQSMRNMLHLNNGNGSFSEIGQIAGVSNTDWSWSALFADFDNDGFQDLFVSNGYKRDFTNNDFLKYKSDQQIKSGGGKINHAEMIEKLPSSKQPNYLFRHTGGHGFDNVSAEWGFGEEILTHGAAYADLDNDGDLDLIMNNMNAPAGVYRNDLGTGELNNYLKIKLVGGDQNRLGIGTRVTVFVKGAKIVREQYLVRGFQSSIEPILHFGLDSISQVDSIHVVWPKGGIQRIQGVAGNQVITISESGDVNFAETNEMNDLTYFNEISVAEISHKENEFVDFNTQPLLPKMYSAEGPALAITDVNGDGFKDLFIGGSKGHSPTLYIGDESSYYVKFENSFSVDAAFEDVDASFFDANNDGFEDLYVVSGGYEFSSNDNLLQDRLYINSGNGEYERSLDKLPKMITSGSCVRPFDYDNDGDIDLFVGGRIVPGRYPEAPRSYILENDGQGFFEEVTSTVAEDISQIGMVTDARWADVNGDSNGDLIVVGEWMGIKIFINQNGKLIDRSSEFLKEEFSGWWNSIEVDDLDGDGDVDFVSGNLGLNNQMKPTSQQPVTMFYGDYDKNGSVDPILFYYIQGQNFPYASRDELLEQIPTLKKNFIDYESYSSAQLEDVLTAEQREDSKMLIASTFETAIFLNDENQGFTRKSLPVQAQFAPINSIGIIDINNDKIQDIILGGNLEKTRVRTGKYTGNNGFVFLGSEQGKFTYLDQTTSGLNITGTVRKIILDENRVLFGRNNASIKVYELNR
jgi:hypothetical protein